jgi:cytochrome c553
MTWQSIFRSCRREPPMTAIEASWRAAKRSISAAFLNIAACVAYHGPNAEGVGEIPRLGGLAYTYLKRRLDQWGQGYHGALALPMPHIANQLSRNQIEELASYLSFLR